MKLLDHLNQDELVKSQHLDGAVKSSRCKARETGNPPRSGGTERSAASANNL
jgi:hypothetical protein